MAFLFVVLYLIVIYLRPGEWVPGFAAWHLLDLTAGGTLAFLLFQLALTKGRLVRVPHTRMLLGLFAAVLASHAVHTYVGEMISSLVGFGKNVITYFLLINTVTSRRRVRVVLSLLAVLTVLLAVQGIQ